MYRNLIDYQNHYTNQPYEKFQVLFRKKKVIEFLKKYFHSNILEIGCGLESIFLDFDDFDKITVIEPGEIFYEKALLDRKRIKNKNINVINLLLEDSIHLLKDNTFDVILISSLLHEISDVELFLKSIREIASEETVIHINVPNADSFHRILAVEMGLIKSQFEKSNNNIEFQQNLIFSIEKLKTILESSGFEIIDSGSYSFKPFTHLQMQMLIDYKIINLEILEGLFKMEKYLPGLGSEIYVNTKIKP